MLLKDGSATPKGYHDLLMIDFRKRFYPFAMLVSFVFLILFVFNLTGFGNDEFVVLDLLAVTVFLALGLSVRYGRVPSWVASALGLCVIMAFYIMDLIFVGSAHGIIFVYCVVPFFAFYLGGVFIGRIQGIAMLSVLLVIWFGVYKDLFTVNYSIGELFLFSVLLIFSIVSAWLFERAREQTFYDSYQKGEQQEALMEAIDEVYYRVDMDGIIQEIGESIYALTGFVPAEVEGHTITTFYANPDERDAYVHLLRSQGYVKNYPIEIVGKQGQQVFISMSSRVVTDVENKPVYIEGMFRDITKEVTSERERQEHLEHLKNLNSVEVALSHQDFEQSIQGAIEEMFKIFIADRVFLTPLCFKQTKEACYQASFLQSGDAYSPFDPEGFVNKPEMVMYLSSLPKSSSGLTQVIDTFDMVSQNMVEQYHLRSHLMVLIQVNFETFWLLGIHQCQQEQSYSEQEKRLLIDISHRIRGALNQLILHKDLEETVKKAEVASKAKSEFLATMSHELRTPLHGVIGLLDLLGEDAGRLSLEQQRNLNLAQTSSHVLSSLIDDVLDLAKVESGKIELQKQTFLLKDALYDVLIPFVVKARSKGLDLSLDMKNVPVMIEGDVVRLRQVLLNLIGNAIKFTKEGYVRIVLTQDEQTLLINIEDSGVGIDHDLHKDVFKPFAQVHDVHILGDNLQEKGTGLGTTIAQHFVEMMGGTLTLQSEPMVGSTLSIRLPLHQVGAERITTMLQMEDFSKLPTATHKVSQPSKKELNLYRVILAEDDPIGRRIAVTRLTRAGFQVDAVNDGQAAWKKMQENHYDLLLTDVRMPNLNGIALARKIRALEIDQGKQAMLIVGLSAYALEEVKHDALASGMDEFVTKPVDMGKLINLLETRCGAG